MSEVRAIIKDCIFESVMMGNDVVSTLRNLHFQDGFDKADIIAAYNEMVEEANEDAE
jgi:hypothetical protein